MITKNLLENKGFEKAKLSWKDTDEILNMRLLDKEFQYHLRLFNDMEIRGHYEYASEAHPWWHINEKIFENRSDFFKKILGDYLI